MRPYLEVPALLAARLLFCSLTLAGISGCDEAEEKPSTNGDDTKELDDSAADDDDDDADDDSSPLDAGATTERDSGSTARDARSNMQQPTKDAAGPSPSQPGKDASAPSGSNDAAAPGGATTCATPEEETFSTFLISYKAIQRESGSPDGFGGNLGGIKGADAICQRVAEHSSPCQKGKVWRAFLSTTKENAIDRIGKGPWHDRVGRLLAKTIPDLLKDRPAGADPQIANDFPNEEGVPNHDPDGTGPVDNHQILTGSGIDGKLYMQSGGTQPGGMGGPTSCGKGEQWTAEKATCWDWTSSEPQGCPRVGHSWPRQGSGINWISVWNEGGCAPGVQLVERGGLDGTRRVGSAGGYGGFYCFAVTSQ